MHEKIHKHRNTISWKTVEIKKKKEMKELLSPKDRERNVVVVATSHILSIGISPQDTTAVPGCFRPQLN